jgi:hypothetical protein
MDKTPCFQGTFFEMNTSCCVNICAMHFVRNLWPAKPFAKGPAVQTKAWCSRSKHRFAASISVECSMMQLYISFKTSFSFTFCKLRCDLLEDATEQVRQREEEHPVLCKVRSFLGAHKGNLNLTSATNQLSGELIKTLGNCFQLRSDFVSKP